MKNDYEIKGETTVVFLNRKNGTRLKASISTSDFDKVNSFPNTWVAQWNPLTKSYYVCGHFPKNGKIRKRISLHRFLFDEPDGFVIDHIDHDTLNNTRKNLRVVTSAQNAQNKRGLNSNNKSGIRGVCYVKQYGKWKGTIVVNQKSIHLGYFEDLIEAEKAVVKARKKYMPFSTEKKKA